MSLDEWSESEAGKRQTVVAESSASAARRYRFGFVLNTTIGNMTRYLNLRKYAELDPTVELVWAPVNHYVPLDAKSPLRHVPAPVLMRWHVLQQARPVMRELRRLDAVMIHLFEADLICALRSHLCRGPVLVSSTDEAPMVDRSRYPLYPNQVATPVWRQKMRLALDRWRVSRTDCFVPFSQWVSGVLVRDCGVPQHLVHPVHVGLDLSVWQRQPRRGPKPGEPLKLLFVGTDFARKGGDLLLDVFRNRFQGRADLHLVTRQAPRDLPPHVIVHDGFQPNDPALVDLYATADLLVVPTSADTGPLWSYMEAMAMGLPVIGTDTGSNTELVRHGETGLIVRVGNANDLSEAIQKLVDDPELRLRMGERGHEIIASQYNAAVNVPRIMRVMKDAVDNSRRLARKGAHRAAQRC